MVGAEGSYFSAGVVQEVCGSVDERHRLVVFCVFLGSWAKALQTGSLSICLIKQKFYLFGYHPQEGTEEEGTFGFCSAPGNGPPVLRAPRLSSEVSPSKWRRLKQ